MTTGIDKTVETPAPREYTLFGVLALIVLIVVLFFALRLLLSPRPQVLS